MHSIVTYHTAVNLKFLKKSRRAKSWITFFRLVRNVYSIHKKYEPIEWSPRVSFSTCACNVISPCSLKNHKNSLIVQYLTYEKNYLNHGGMLLDGAQSTFFSLSYICFIFVIVKKKCMCSHVKSVLISGFYRRFWNDRKPVLLGYCKAQHIAVYRGFTSWNTSETSLWMMLVIFTGFA